MVTWRDTAMVCFKLYTRVLSRRLQGLEIKSTIPRRYANSNIAKFILLRE
jgi:hypothetical protein